MLYVCKPTAHVGRLGEPLDEYVETAVLGYLSDPETRQRLAVLYRSDPHRRARLFAFIANLRGWSVQPFDNYEAALTWLSGDAGRQYG